MDLHLAAEAPIGRPETAAGCHSSVMTGTSYAVQPDVEPAGNADSMVSVQLPPPDATAVMRRP